MNGQRIITMHLLAGIMVLFSICPGAQAAADVVVRLEAHPENPWVGQKVVLLLDVLGKDSWAQLKKVHDFDVQGGYLKRYESQGTRLNETINGASYTGQRYEFLFFPQRPGELPIASMAIDVEVKDWGSSSANEMVHETTPALKLNVRKPPGVQSAVGIISTANFSVVQKWEPESTDLSAGDAIKRTVVFKAADLSGMVLPGVETEQIPGIGMYPSSPRVDDQYSRGELTGLREETITYVMEQPGSHQLQELVFSWWNTETEEIGTVTLDGRTLTIAAVQENSNVSAAADALTAKMDRRYLWGFAGLFVLTLLFSLLWRFVISSRYEVWKEKAAHSEKSYFTQVKNASRSGDPLALMNAAMQWLDRISNEEHPSRLDQFAARYGSPDAVENISEFGTLAHSDDPSRHRTSFYETLATLRANWLAAEKQRRTVQNAEQILPPIGIE